MAQVKMTDEEILDLVRPDIDRARAYQDDLSAERYKAYSLYRFEKLGNERDGFSQVVDSVAWNAIEWMKPNISSVFRGDFFNLISDNEDRAKRFKDYIRYLFYRKQDGKRLVKDFVHSGCMYHYGIFKVYYKEDYNLRQGTIDAMSEEEFLALAQRPDIVISKYEEVVTEVQNPVPPMEYMLGGPQVPGEIYSPVVTQTSYEKVKFVKKELKFAGPWTDVVPPWELYYIPGYQTLDETPFVAHRVKRTLDYVRRKERDGTYKKGTYNRVKEKIDNRRGYSETDSEYQQQWWVEGLTAPDDHGTDADYSNELRLAQNEVWVWECYLNLDIDKDGLLERCIVTICEDEVMQEPQENPYDCIPFILGSAHKEPFKLEGYPIPLMVEEEQKEQTNLRRLILDSAAESSYRTVVTNNQQMAAQWAKRVMGDAIVGNVDQFKEVNVQSPSQYNLRAYELGNGRIENKTGVTSYNQGLNADSLNKTATGISMIMNASQMRLRSITENFAGAFEQLIRRYIKIIQMYPPDDMVRVIGGEIQITQDDLDARYDIEIDIGVGPQERNLVANHLNEHIGFLVQAGIGAGIATPVHLIRTVLKKYEMLGIDVKDLIGNPEEIERKMQAAQQDAGMMGRLDGAIKQMGQQGMPAQEIGMRLIEMIGGYHNERESAARGNGKPDGNQGGGGRGPEAAGSSRTQALPGQVRPGPA